MKAVIFDLDDTLYPERDFVMGGFRTVSRYVSETYHFEYDKIFSILQNDFNEGLRKKNLNVLLQKLNLDNVSVDKLIKLYREHIPVISLYSDAKSLLEKLRGRLKLGMITDGYIVQQKNKIHALDIEDYFEVITINDITKNVNKMDTKSFKEILNKLIVDSDAAIYVGDNPLKDFYAAKETGVHTVRIKRNRGEYNNITVDKKYNAEYTIQNLLQLLDIINKNG